MGSNDQETGKVEAGDPLANEARREVLVSHHPLQPPQDFNCVCDIAPVSQQKPDDGFLDFARNLGRACWQAAADDDAGLLGGTI